MVVNFPKPAKGKVGTMGHADVRTFFHEFGHIMHNLLTKAHFSEFAGAQVERDFVELPS